MFFKKHQKIKSFFSVIFACAMIFSVISPVATVFAEEITNEAVSPEIETVSLESSLEPLDQIQVQDDVEQKTASIILNGDTSGDYFVGDSWTLNLSTNIPNTSFTMCAVANGDSSCTPNWGTTDANGNWSQSSSFSSADVGTWVEHVEFPTLGISSNEISFTISPKDSETENNNENEEEQVTANLLINNQIAGNFTVGDSWVLNLSTSPAMANQPVQICTTEGHPLASCTPANELDSPLPATTDTNGSWSGSGSFDSSTIGDWVEYVKIGTGENEVISNNIVFTVSAASSNTGSSGSSENSCTDSPLACTNTSASYTVVYPTCEMIYGEGWLGYYYNYKSTTEGMNLPTSMWSTSYGDPLTSGDKASVWYSNEFYRFSRVDSSINFGNNFFPFDSRIEESYTVDSGTHDYHFGVHWIASVTATTTGDYNFNIISDDDSWVYVNGVLVVKNDGVHSAKDVLGTAHLVAGENIVEVFFAERHYNDSYMAFEFADSNLVIEPYLSSCRKENTPPTITLIGSNPLTLTVGGTFTDPGATATDTEDGDLTSKIKITGSVETTVVGTTTLIYTVTDSAGASASTTRTIVISPKQVENTAPKITLIGDNPMNLFVGDTFTDPSATATDTEDGDLTSKIISTSTVNTSIVGTYTVTYSVTDSGGLSASVIRNVIVSEKDIPPSNNTAPVISLIGNNPLNLTVGDTFTDPGATATDTEDGDLTSKIVATSTVDVSTAGTYTVEYSVTDSEGLSANVTRSVVVSNKNDDDEDEEGGGGGHSGSRHHSTGEVLGATTCSYLKDYLNINWQNDKVEVLKVQSFLNQFEGENLTYTGVFDQATFEAVSRFQNKYKDEILTPWGHTAPTGFVYILTKKKINEIYCNAVYPLSQVQQEEIDQFKSSLGNGAGAATAGQSVGSLPGSGTNGKVLSDNSLKENVLNEPVINLKDNNITKPSIKNMAVSMFSMSQNVSAEKILIIFILLVLVFAIYKIFKKTKMGKTTEAEPVFDEEIVIENENEEEVVEEPVVEVETKNKN